MKQPQVIIIIIIIIIINPLTVRVIRAPQKNLKPLCSISIHPVQTLGLSIPQYFHPTSSFFRLIFFTITLREINSNITKCCLHLHELLREQSAMAYWQLRYIHGGLFTLILRSKMTVESS